MPLGACRLRDITSMRICRTGYVRHMNCSLLTCISCTAIRIRKRFILYRNFDYLFLLFVILYVDVYSNQMLVVTCVLREIPPVELLKSSHYEYKVCEHSKLQTNVPKRVTWLNNNILHQHPATIKPDVLSESTHCNISVDANDTRRIANRLIMTITIIIVRKSLPVWSLC
jgi:hypothetical protein